MLLLIIIFLMIIITVTVMVIIIICYINALFTLYNVNVGIFRWFLVTVISL